MTIFLKIAKEFLEREIIAIREASIAEDNSSTNATLTYFKYGRDTTLSAAKRTLLEELVPVINASTDGDNDTITLVQLKLLITNCRKAAATKSYEKGYGEGSFGPAMQGIENLLQSIYEKLAVLELVVIRDDKDPLNILGICDDKDPLNIFCYFAALYAAQKVADAHHAGIATHLAMHPHVSTRAAVATKKEELIVAAIKSCRRVLSTLKISPGDKAQERQEYVLAIIQKLQWDNLALCEAHALKASFLSSIKVSLSVLQPSVGFLQECMERAAAAIGEPTASAAASAELAAAPAAGAGAGGAASAPSAAGAEIRPGVAIPPAAAETELSSASVAARPAAADPTIDGAAAGAAPVATEPAASPGLLLARSSAAGAGGVSKRKQKGEQGQPTTAASMRPA